MARRRRKSSKSVSTANAQGLGQGVSPSRVQYPSFPTRAPAWGVVSMMQLPPRFQAWTAQSSDRMARADALLKRHKAQQALASQVSETSPAQRSSDRARDHRCKERPDSKKAARTPKGSGGFRKFVPWC